MEPVKEVLPSDIICFDIQGGPPQTINLRTKVLGKICILGAFSHTPNSEESRENKTSATCLSPEIKTLQKKRGPIDEFASLQPPLTTLIQNRLLKGP